MSLSDDERAASSTSSDLVHRCFAENRFDCHLYLHRSKHESDNARRLRNSLHYQTKRDELAEIKQHRGAAEVDGDVLFNEQDATMLANLKRRSVRVIRVDFLALSN